MAHPSRRKGNRFEREIVNDAEDAGVPGERAYASNGRALGHTENVDCLIGGYRVQAKRRKKIAGYMTPDADVDIQIIRGDRGDTLAVLPYETLLDLIRRARKNEK